MAFYRILNQKIFIVCQVTSDITHLVILFWPCLKVLSIKIWIFIIEDGFFNVLI